MRLLLALLCLALPSLPTPLHARETPAPAPGLVEAAQALIGATPAAQRPRLQAPFSSAERTRWHYVPRHRFGLPRGEMSATQRTHLDTLLGQLLTPTGFQLAYDIVRTEEVMYANVGERSRRRNPAWRNPGLYHVAFFGTPKADARWGFRMEGHHLSLNVTLDGERIVASEPTFFGASPDHVTRGSLHRGLRPLARQQDLAFAFLRGLTPETRARAIVSARAPGEIMLRERRALVRATAEGVRIRDLAPEAQQRFAALWAAWHAPFRGPAGARKIPADATFSWRGATRATRHHYYRIHSAGVVIEFSWHGQHIHSVIRHRSTEMG